MQYITTTQLRTMTTDLIASLAAGESVELVHRSKIVGEIKPKKLDPRPFDPNEFFRIMKGSKLKKYTTAQMERNYREHIMKKYGQGFS
ncbi:MAG: hypothetical protein M1484_02530 [Patescibacteria group bacterium]|nr:hypothetical protein [Patescibacteria group bacterium]MCL5431957.1 hypothetical protein [Patescibacteria group bacterium]